MNENSSAESLSHKTLRNFGFSFLGYIFPIVFTIVITPVIVHRLGVGDYGVLLLLNTITGFLSLMDLGVGLAVVKYVAEYHARGEDERLQALLSSARTLFLLFGLIGLCVFGVLGKFFLHSFHIESIHSSYVLLSFVYAGLTFLVTSITAIYAYIPKSLQRYDLSVTIGLAQVIAVNLLNLVLVLNGYGLHALLMANLVTGALAFAFYVWRAKQVLPVAGFGLGWDATEIKNCYSFGLQIFITNISNNTLAQFDRLIIPLYTNPAQLAYYSLPGNIAEKINGVTGSTTGVLFPLMSSLQGREEDEKIKTIYMRIVRNVIVVACAMAIPVMLFSHKLLQYWLGDEFAKNGTSILIILAATNFFLAMYGVLQNFLIGYGRVKFLMKSSLCMAALNVLLLFGLVPFHGIIGAAWAYLIAVLPIVWFYIWTEKKILMLSGRFEFYRNLFFKLAFTSGVFSALFYLVFSPLLKSLMAAILLGPVAVLTFLGLYWVFGFFAKEDVVLGKDYMRKVLKFQ